MKSSSFIQFLSLVTRPVFAASMRFFAWFYLIFGWFRSLEKQKTKSTIFPVKSPRFQMKPHFFPVKSPPFLPVKKPPHPVWIHPPHASALGFLRASAHQSPSARRLGGIQQHRPREDVVVYQMHVYLMYVYII